MIYRHTECFHPILIHNLLENNYKFSVTRTKTGFIGLLNISKQVGSNKDGLQAYWIFSSNSNY